MICLKKKRIRLKAGRAEGSRASFGNPCGRLHPTLWNGGLASRNDGFANDNSLYSETDPNGSYTGVPRESDEVPVQDVDDL